MLGPFLLLRWRRCREISLVCESHLGFGLVCFDDVNAAGLAIEKLGTSVQSRESHGCSSALSAKEQRPWILVDGAARFGKNMFFLSFLILSTHRSQI